MIFLPIISLGFLILFLIGALISFQYYSHFLNLTMSERTHILDQRQRAQTALGYLVAFIFAAVVALGGFIFPAIIGFTPDPFQPLDAAPSSPGISPTFPAGDNPEDLPPSQISPTAPVEPTLALTSTPILPKATIGNTGGAGANVRSIPGLGGTIIEVLADGTRVILSGEIEEVDGFEWQPIEMSDTREGWVVVQFLIPDN